MQGTPVNSYSVMNNPCEILGAGETDNAEQLAVAECLRLDLFHAGPDLGPVSGNPSGSPAD